MLEVEKELEKKGNASPILEVKKLKKHFPVEGIFGKLGKNVGVVKAVDGVSFKLYEGETYGLVGESGCGKSTTGRAIINLIEPTSGEVLYNGNNILKQNKKENQKMRQELQMIFQDPYSSLNPRKRIGQTVEEPLVIHGIGNAEERTKIAMDILEKVGMRIDHYYRYPHELSGGQMQRIGLARALIMNPKIIIADEPVSALDVSIQSQVINLLKNLQEELKLTYLFIAHDISVVRHISDRIGVMYLGHIIEEGPTDELIKNPLHPYTKALLASVPIPNPKFKRERIILKGELPSPLDPPAGCVFNTRCPLAMDICTQKKPVLEEKENGQKVACFYKV